MQGNKFFWNTADLPKITGTAPMGCVMKVRQFFCQMHDMLALKYNNSINMLAWFADAESH